MTQTAPTPPRFRRARPAPASASSPRAAERAPRECALARRADEAGAQDAACTGMESRCRSSCRSTGASSSGPRRSRTISRRGRRSAPAARVRPRARPPGGGGDVARGGSGAMTMVAAGDSGTLQTRPPTCTCGRWPSGLRRGGKIDLKRPVADNIEAIAEAFGRRVGDITTIVSDSRHHDLIEEIRRPARASSSSRTEM